MATEKGYCRHCGQVKVVTVSVKKGEAPTEIQLVEAATSECQCHAAKRERATKKAVDAIPVLFGPNVHQEIGTPVKKEIHPLLQEIAILVATEELGQVTIKLNANETATFKGGHESFKIKRKKTREHESTF
jgi:hypothetical protein